jgi:hypothetical protein
VGHEDQFLYLCQLEAHVDRTPPLLLLAKELRLVDAGVREGFVGPPRREAILAFLEQRVPWKVRFEDELERAVSPEVEVRR